MESQTSTLHCSSCHKTLKKDDIVTLDLINTITHSLCSSSGLPVKDFGTFIDIQKKYPFLE